MISKTAWLINFSKEKHNCGDFRRPPRFGAVSWSLSRLNETAARTLLPPGCPQQRHCSSEKVGLGLPPEGLWQLEGCISHAAFCQKNCSISTECSRCGCCCKLHSGACFQSNGAPPRQAQMALTAFCSSGVGTRGLVALLSFSMTSRSKAAH